MAFSERVATRSQYRRSKNGGLTIIAAIKTRLKKVDIMFGRKRPQPRAKHVLRADLLSKLDSLISDYQGVLGDLELAAILDQRATSLKMRDAMTRPIRH